MLRAANERLDECLTHVAFALGGGAGSRLLKDLGVVVSGDTLLNHICSMRLSGFETPRVLSVDESLFAGEPAMVQSWWISSVTCW
jgi:hypothetical protein